LRVPNSVELSEPKNLNKQQQYMILGKFARWAYSAAGNCEVHLSSVVIVTMTISMLQLQGIGEPPLLLSCAVFYALRSAVQSARDDAGLSSQFVFNSPATVAQILRACSLP